MKLPYEKISLVELEENLLNNDSPSDVIDVCGFFLCQHGWAKVLLNKQTYIIKEGDVYIYTPASYIRLIERSEDLEGMAVKSWLNVVIPFIKNTMDTQQLLQLRDKPCITLTTEQRHRLEHLTDMLEEHRLRLESMNGDALGAGILRQQINNLAETCFDELLYDYFCNTGIEPVQQDGRDKIFQLFMLSLMRNYKKHREVSYYAQEQCLSPRYFSTVVREKSGHTASEWIIEMVVSNACQMLSHTDKSIKEIADELNFPTQSFFGKYFKNYVGISPKEYKKRGK